MACGQNYIKNGLKSIFFGQIVFFKKGCGPSCGEGEAEAAGRFAPLFQSPTWKPEPCRRDLIAARIYDKYSVGPSIRPSCTKCCLRTTHMIQVRSDLIEPEYLSCTLVRMGLACSLREEDSRPLPSEEGTTLKV